MASFLPARSAQGMLLSHLFLLVQEDYYRCFLLYMGLFYFPSWKTIHSWVVLRICMSLSSNGRASWTSTHPTAAPPNLSLNRSCWSLLHHADKWLISNPPVIRYILHYHCCTSRLFKYTIYAHIGIILQHIISLQSATRSPASASVSLAGSGLLCSIRLSLHETHWSIS